MMRRLAVIRVCHTIVAGAMAMLAATAAEAQRGPRGAGQTRLRIDTTFAFDKSGELTIAAGAGEVRVTGWARPDVRIVAIRESGGLTMSASSAHVRLDARPQSLSRSRLDVSVPIGVRVVISALNADVDVSGTQSELHVTTTRGEITASDGSGASQIATTAGDVKLQRFTGDTRVTTLTAPLRISEISGTLRITAITAPTTIERAELTNFQFDAAQGTLDFGGRLLTPGPHHIGTFGGNVELRFPADFGATLQVASLNGKLHAVDFPVTLHPRDNERQNSSDDQQTYTINGGGAVISVSTLNGAVFLRKMTAANRR